MSNVRHLDRTLVRVLPLFLLALLLSPFLATDAHGGNGDLSLFGADYAGENFVFCLDSTDAFATTQDFLFMKEGVIRGLRDLTPQQNFSVVAFGSGVSTFSQAMVPASLANVTLAEIWISNLSAAGAPCLADPLVVSLNILNFGATGPGQLGSVILFSFALPACPSAADTLSIVAGMNVLQAPIHTIRAPSGHSSVIPFLQTLAADNGGSFQPFPELLPLTEVIRGDANGDGSVNLADAIAILTVGFGLGTGPICKLAADANDDNVFTPIADATTILGVLFLSGFPPLAAPSPHCGTDSTPSGLSCVIHDCP